MSVCNCVDHDPITCLAQRSGATSSLTACIGACECRCHIPPKGMLITPAQWQANRARMERPVRPARDEITDPRIQALMQEAQQ